MRSPPTQISRIFTLLVATAALALLCLSGCRRAESARLQGYIEGEFVYVAAPSAGRLQKLAVQRGQEVAAGDALFELDDVPERAARDEAAGKLVQARANFADLTKGRRPEEIEAVTAQLNQARAALLLSERELARHQDLVHSGAAAKQELDRARATHEQDRERAAQLEAELRTARLGARADQVAAAEANVKALGAALEKAQWELAQKRQAAPQASDVFDTLFREGEWVSAGRPVVALLPPRNIKVRTFIPEPRLGAVHIGDAVRVRVDGTRDPFPATLSFISPRAEYTPPVIYSRESRGKLVFMIEAVFAPEAAAKLHPGQPVDVELTR